MPRPPTGDVLQASRDGREGGAPAFSTARGDVPLRNGDPTVDHAPPGVDPGGASGWEGEGESAGKPLRRWHRAGAAAGRDGPPCMVLEPALVGRVDAQWTTGAGTRLHQQQVGVAPAGWMAALLQRPSS
eukprot:scaffold439_cov415-Prasinococcus_capsulatus_cf.AAC.40